MKLTQNIKQNILQFRAVRHRKTTAKLTGTTSLAVSRLDTQKSCLCHRDTVPLFAFAQVLNVVEWTIFMNNNHAIPELDPERILETFMEINALTKIKRAGWILMGIPDPESIADHCFETAMFAFILSKYVGQPVDIRKVLLMALFHEIGEVRLMDLPRRASRYIKAAKKTAEHNIMLDVLDGVADDVPALLEEMEGKETLEARLCEAAEELQIIFKALVYAKENRGDTSEYRNDVAKYDALGIEPAKQVAELIATKLNDYLGKKHYWPIGYRHRD